MRVRCSRARRPRGDTTRALTRQESLTQKETTARVEITEAKSHKIDHIQQNGRSHGNWCGFEIAGEPPLTQKKKIIIKRLSALLQWHGVYAIREKCPVYICGNAKCINTALGISAGRALQRTRRHAEARQVEEV